MSAKKLCTHGAYEPILMLEVNDLINPHAFIEIYTCSNFIQLNITWI